MRKLPECVNDVRARQQRQWLWICFSRGLVFGAAAGCLAGVYRLATTGSLPLYWIVVSLIVGPLLGVLYAGLKPRRLNEAAVAIDRSYSLKDRVATALRFLERGNKSALCELQISDAESHVSKVVPTKVVPLAAPRSWGWGLALTCVAIVLGFVSGPPEKVAAEIVSNEVVATQADRVTESLEELQEFNEEEIDPEVEKLLKSLTESIEELKKPGMDPKEALAKLSEMESVLQKQQDKIAQLDTEAALQEIGNALSLAEQLKAAGQAMSQGNMEKAESLLAKLEMPKLDRQTEKAITEKLDAMAENKSGSASDKLKNALAKLSAGLSQGNRNKFRDGCEGLAGECKKQGRRKKLTDLLRKQCKCLGECKSECEGQCKNEGKGKGGNNWGLGRSGNEPGDKTMKLNTHPEMRIKGQESDQGEVDVETISSSEQEQEGVRKYRSQAQKYEQLSESVLSSEPIPLGHRQTIRRYFESIRPKNGETDQVFEVEDRE